jgi:membrane protease YdiL (CAAX protease family)
MALVIPTAVAMHLLPLPAPDAEMLRTSAARIAPLHAHPWMLALHALVVAPLCEEFVYRGLILQLLRRYLPLWAAVLIPTLLFAGTHFTFNYQNAVLAGVVGLFFAWLVVRSGSLFPAMLCHAGVNLTAVFLLRPLAEACGWKSAHDVPVTLIVAGTVACVALMAVAVRKLAANIRPRRDALAVYTPVTLASA